MRGVFLLLFLVPAIYLKGQVSSDLRLSEPVPVHADSLSQLLNSLPMAQLPARFSGAGNATCASAITLTPGSSFTCNSFASNPNAAAFPNACVTTSGFGIQNFRTDWYCVNSGTNKTLALVMRNVVNTTSFNLGVAVFGPFTSCAAGCAGAMSGPMCDNGMVFQYDSIKILENITQNRFYMIAVIERRSSLDIAFGATVSYCISVQPTNLDDCEVLPSGCPVTCGNLCVFEQATLPTVSSVVASCSQKMYSHRIQGWNIASPEDSVEFCYNFRVDSSCTMRFGGVITASGCGVGNLSSATWRIYNLATCTVAYSGTSIPPAAAVSATGNYIFCMKYSAACDLHYGTYYYGYGTCVVQQPLLPVELSRFSAEKETYGIGLSWQTLTETNNNYFSIERSEDGIRFEEIGKVGSFAPGGYSITALNYYFHDAAPLHGLNYYRLRQYDFDGTYSFSPIVVANNSSDAFRVLGFLSSHVSEDPVLMFENNREDKIEVSIMNTLGKTVTEETIGSVEGLNSYAIPLSLAGSAMYIIQLRNSRDELAAVRYLKIK